MLVDAISTNDKVVNLTFRGELGLELQQIIDIFGEPEFVFAIGNLRNDIDIDFINPSQGVRFGYIADGETSEVSPDTEIALLQLFDTSIYQEMLEEGLLTSGRYDPEKFNYYSWAGYGSIVENYWPPGKP